MTDAELADIMAMDALRDTSRTIRLSNPDPVDIQNLKAVLVLANIVPTLVRALREDRQKLDETQEDLRRLLGPHDTVKEALASQSSSVHLIGEFQKECERLKMEPHRYLLGLMVKVFGDTAKYPGEVALVREAKELLK